MEVGQLYARIGVKDEDFIKGVAKAKGKLDELGATADKAETRTARAFAGMGRKAAAAVHGVTATLTTAGIATATLAGAVAKTGYNYNRLQQSSRTALATLMGGAKQANAQMDKLDAFARTSPFAKDVFIKAQQQLLGFGVEAKKVLPTLDAIQNAVAATGGNSQQVGELSFVLAQINAAGKITGQDLIQLGQRGVNAAQLIGDAMGKTGAEVKTLISKGAISASDALDYITAGMAKKFGGATDKIKQQMDGATDRIKGATRDIGSVIAEPFVSKKGGGAAVEWANLTADGLRKVEKIAGGAFGRLDASSGGLAKISAGLRRVNLALDKVDGGRLVHQLDQLRPYASVITGIGAAFTAMGASSLPVIGSLVGGINPVVAGLVAMAAASPAVRKEIGGIAVEAKTLLQPMGRIAVTVLETATALIDELAPAAGDVGRALVDVAGDTLPVVELFADLLRAGVPLVGVLGDAASIVSSIPAPVLLMAAAFVAVNHAAKTFTPALKSAGESVALYGLYAKDAAVKITSISGAASVAKAGIKGVGNALKSAFLSNPVGIAIMALAATIGYFASSQAEAKANAEELSGTLDEQTGAITKNTRAIVAKQLRESGALSVAKQYGIALNDMVDDVLGEADAHERVTKALAEYNKTQGASTTAKIQGQEVTTATVDANDVYANSIDTVKTSLADEISKAKDLAAATGENTRATQRNSEVLEENRRIVEGRNNALTQAVNAADSFRKAQQDLNKVVKDGGRAVLDAKGGLDIYSQANHAVIDPLLKMSRAALDQTAALEKQSEPAEKIAAKWRENQAAFRKAAEQAGITGAALDELTAKAGLAGEYSAINLEVKADTKTFKQDVDNALSVMSKKTGTLKVDANSDPAIKKLLETTGKIDNATGIATLDANNDRAIMELLLTLGAISRETGVLKIDGDTAPGDARRRELERRINTTYASVKIGANVADAYRAIAAVVHDARSARANIPALSMSHANGAVVDYYAHGGVRDAAHVAQIAPAGAYRVWAEPETGGEAYIPLAKHKRHRSLQILEEVSRRFGLMLTPKAGQQFANGGVQATAIKHSPAQPTTVILKISDDLSVRAYFEDIATGKVLEGMSV